AAIREDPALRRRPPQRRGVGARPTQPVALLLRPDHWGRGDRGRRTGQVRGGRLREARPAPREELRLVEIRGRPHVLRRGGQELCEARPGALALAGLLLDHGRLYRPRPLAQGALRALRLRRLLPAAVALGPTETRPRHRRWCARATC